MKELNRTENRKAKRGFKGGKILNSMLASYGLSSMHARTASKLYASALRKLESAGFAEDDDYAVNIAAALEALYSIAPEKVEMVVPFAQGEASVPDFVPEPFRSMLRGSASVMRLIKLAAGSDGQPLLRIHRLSDDEMVAIARRANA